MVRRYMGGDSTALPMASSASDLARCSYADQPRKLPWTPFFTSIEPSAMPPGRLQLRNSGVIVVSLPRLSTGRTPQPMIAGRLHYGLRLRRHRDACLAIQRCGPGSEVERILKEGRQVRGKPVIEDREVADHHQHPHGHHHGAPQHRD